ncbi:MAG: hypothetical protein A2452_10125 [Candidatus Firestonebacteria bacterium RIFOXYC2_FULL_39_67]|nr:MAG: hypothetical protein A2536_06495 [Candidatus Firestonebacteria bacterium RIFOXYD2_FULL_39_29]OGF54260.1 MAG: hypothetical protein A2452_10125 [Candidatus Firestonebacteria bacterium RIFOXYC2_FULL_39_67]OGF56894.1 MAG: hypothetical protein A2497_06095 [Candidatus Firestonebacteria bacterium RifOxyC12_full_39_7]
MRLIQKLIMGFISVALLMLVVSIVAVLFDTRIEKNIENIIEGNIKEVIGTTEINILRGQRRLILTNAGKWGNKYNRNKRIL